MLKFSIRDALFVTTIAALAAGWWIDRRALQRAHGLECATMTANYARLEREADAMAGALYPPDEACGYSSWIRIRGVLMDRVAERWSVLYQQANPGIPPLPRSATPN
jgi:hypothetical protein